VKVFWEVWGNTPKIQARMKIFLMFFAFYGGLSLAAVSQDLEQPKAISDDELKKFALVSVMTSDYLEKKTGELKQMILSQKEIYSGARYNEIKRVWGNASKEQAIKLTEEERLAFRSVSNVQDSLQQSILSYQVGLIKNEKVLGESTYLRITEALQQDPVLKEKLDALVKSLETKKSVDD
jgi:hypothetical protein